MRVNRKHIQISKMKSAHTETPADITKSEAISFLWELTQEVFSLSGRYDVKSRLQRHVVSITRARR
jgi:hypothetical protein